MNDPVRDFLNSVRDVKFSIGRCRRKIEQLRSECERVTAVITGAPGGHTDEHKDSMWATLADYCTDLSDLYKQSVRQEQSVQSFIDRLDSPEQRAVLTLRYVDLLRWSDIAGELESLNLCFSERQVYRIHGAALEAARRLWESEGVTE